MPKPIDRSRKAKIASIPAPVGGLNARDAYADMDPKDAIVLDNLFPTTSYVSCRNGSNAWSTGLPSAVNTVACYSPPDGSRQLFAASNGNIYDVTNNAAVGAAVYTGNTSDWWQTCNFGAGGGQYLVMVNGQDPMLTYNGSGWESVGDGPGAVIASGTATGATATITTTTPHKLATGQTVTVTGATPSAYNVSNAVITVTGATTFTYTTTTAPGGAMTTIGAYIYAPAITGVDTSTFVSVNNFMGRLFFIVKNSMQVYYLPLLSIGGAATMLDLSSQTLLGGSLIAMATWTLETTNGSVQVACFITSEGEVITYQGNDPSLASSWFQVGSFRIGRPIGYRCWAKLGSDVVVITADGIVPLSKALLTDRTQREIAVSDKIRNLINTDIQNYANLQGWQVFLHPIGNKLIINVPAPRGHYQYVMNTMTNAWCRFVGWDANCFALVEDSLFFGGDGVVYEADVGQNDEGKQISCTAIQAPNYFGGPLQKLFTMARPVFSATGPVSPALQINPDFSVTKPIPTAEFATSDYTYWGSPWESPWSAVLDIYKNWITVGSVGYSGSVAIQFNVNGATVNWQSTDVALQLGAVF